MAEQADLGLEFILQETELGSPEFREKREVWRQDLESVLRFAEEPTIHKSTLLEHVLNVNSLAQSMSGYLGVAHGILLDGRKISRFAHHHDDAEVETGDIPSPIKAAFTPQEREEFERQEDEAMVNAAERYMPERFRQLYLDDWKELSAKQTPEAQVVEIADKWDGLCEVLTDIRCGNDTPEIFAVLENYQALFRKINTFPIMEVLKQNPTFGFEHIPTTEEAKDLSPIRLDLLAEDDGKNKFWKRVFDPSLPAIYKHWLFWSGSRGKHDLGKFPRYKDFLSLPEYRLSQEEKMNLLREMNGNLTIE